MNDIPRILFSSGQDPRSWDVNAQTEGSVITCMTYADAKKAETIFNGLQERIHQYDHVIQAVATALGGVCCGGIDVEGPGSTKDVLVGAIEKLKSERWREHHE